AITPGAIHNERFGLEKHIRGLDYEPSTGTLRFQRNDPSIDYAARPDYNWSVAGRGLKPEDLPSHVDKEMSEQLLGRPLDERGYHRLDNLADVTIGGEGMKYAYDKMVPKLLQKELQKLDPSIKYGQQNLLPYDTEA